MKIYNVFLISLAVAALIGCNKEIVTPSDDVINMPLDPSEHYIHFDADVSTKGALVEGDLLLDDFMVLGYQYPGLWEAESILAMPNVFDDKPQLVKYDDGVFSYGVPKVWTGNRYSFFAYYPSEHDNINLFDDGNIKQGDPYITYSLPDSNDPRELVDIMTASYIDTGVASSSSVLMEFHHRLSAINVGARNYYEYDHDNDAATPDKQVTIEIKKLVVYLENIVNISAKIFLDHTIPSVYTVNQTKASKVYAMVNENTPWAISKFDVIPNTNTDRAIRLVKDENDEDVSSILLIPQTDLLQGALELVYKKKYQDDNGDWVYLHEGNNTEDYEFAPTDLNVNFSKQLIEGRRYYIELTFTSDAVSVNIIAADEWDDMSDIEHEFE